MSSKTTTLEKPASMADQLYGTEPDEVQKTKDRLRIRYVDVNLIKPLEKNFKRHALIDTKKSIRRRGVIDPIGINRTTGANYDGNGRVEALQEMREEWMDAGMPEAGKDFSAPRGVIVVGQTWYVPTVDGVAMDEREEVSAAAALNRIGELGGYDEAMMAEVLGWLKDEPDGLEATGFSDDDVDDIIKRFEKSRETEDGEGDGDGDGRPVIGGGMTASAPISNTRQIALILSPEQHAEFIEMTMTLSERFQTTNVTDTVIHGLRQLLKAKK